VVWTSEEVHAAAYSFVESMSQAMLFTRNLRGVQFQRWTADSTTPHRVLKVPLE